MTMASSRARTVAADVERTAPSSAVTVSVRYFAAAKAATGIATEQLDVPAPATISDVLAAAQARHGADLARVLPRCSFLLDEVAVRTPSTPLGPGATIDVLPPFAGG